MQGAKVAKMTNTLEIHKELVRRIRAELHKVDEQLETYIPEAVLLEGSSLTIRISLDELTTVHADFKHIA